MRQHIKVLGSYGTKMQGEGTTCIQVSDKVLIDAGNIINALGDNAQKIEHVFLTHSHIDHIQDLPFLLDLYYASQRHTLEVYALEETIEALKVHLFNFDFYPDFSQIALQNSTHMALNFNVIELGKTYQIDEVSIMPIRTNHTVPSCGYRIGAEQGAILFTSDTCVNDEIWELINHDSAITTLITEMSFPSRLEALAYDSKHYTPKILHQELEKLKRDDIALYLTHCKPNYYDEISDEVAAYDLLKNGGSIVHEGCIIPYDAKPLRYKRKLSEREIFERLIQTGIALSSYSDQGFLEKEIVQSAMELTRCDGGTLYFMNASHNMLEFAVLINKSLGIKKGGIYGSVDWEPLPLLHNNGAPNLTFVSTSCANLNRLINIEDVYNNEEYDFSGSKQYDAKSGYRTRSVLAVAMLDHEENVIGVLQLINKKSVLDEMIVFDKQDEMIARALASQAAVSITNRKLIADLEGLLENFLQTINLALDEKSPYTVGHTDRMVDLAIMLAKSISADTESFVQKHYNDDEIKEIHISALMYDIGKIVTPEHIMDKRTKLEALFDRIVLVRMKGEVLKRDLKIAMLERFVDANAIPQEAREAYETRLRGIDDDITFLSEANQGSTFFSDETLLRLERIAKEIIEVNGVNIHLLNNDEFNNLKVRKGTLTDEERQEINRNANVFLGMLNALPFPQKLKNVPRIAGGRHEKIRGQNVEDEDAVFKAQILAVADIFEALTDADRPYKKAKKLSEAMQIIYYMAKDGDINRDICRFFYESGLYLEYARKYMNADTIDDVNLNFDFADALEE